MKSAFRQLEGNHNLELTKFFLIKLADDILSEDKLMLDIELTLINGFREKIKCIIQEGLKKH